MKDMSEEKRDCIVCGTPCRIVMTCKCGDSGCDGSPKLVPRLDIKSLESTVERQLLFIANLESRLSQAEAELQSGSIWEHAKMLQARLSHLMDVAGKMAGALKYYSNPDDWDGGGFEGENAKIILCKSKNQAGYVEAKLALAEWDGIKEKTK